MIELKQEYKKNGLILKQLEKVANKAIYEVFFKKVLLGYETIIVRSVNSNGNLTERYPGNEEFGLYGWSYQHYDMAKKKYNEVGCD